MILYESHSIMHSGASIAEPVSSSSRRSSSMSGKNKMADQRIQQRTEELANSTTETWGQAFTKWSELAEEAIFPVNVNDRRADTKERRRKNHRDHELEKLRQNASDDRVGNHLNRRQLYRKECIDH